VQLDDYASGLDIILTRDQPLVTVDLFYYHRQKVEELRDRLKYLRPEAGGEVIGTAVKRARHRLTEGAVDGVRTSSAAHATRADHGPGEGEGAGLVRMHHADKSQGIP